MYVGDVGDRSNTPKGCNAMYVGDVEDRSNTPKGCNVMYVGDVGDRSNTPKGCNAMYVKGVKDGKEHTHTFWLITSVRVSRGYTDYHQGRAIHKANSRIH